MRAKQWREGVLISILLLVALWLGTLIWGLADKVRVAVSKAREASTEYRLTEERKASLEASVAALETERGKDAAIRTAFGVARQGEEVVVVVPLAVTTPTTTSPWWQKVLDWF